MKRLLNTLAVIVSLLGAGALVFAAPVSAQVDAGLNAVGETVKLPATDPRVIATNIINVALGLVGIILVVLILYGGFLYMTSGGEEEKLNRAKKVIRNAIIGLVIVLSSWAIARFVIENLLKATQEGGGAVDGGGGGVPGGFGGSGGAQSFQVKSISPQGAVPIRNVQVKLLFTRTVDDKSVSAIVVTKDGGSTVGGTFAVNGAAVLFTPSDPCPTPNEKLFCFDGDGDFTITIGSGLRSNTGQSIVCGGFAPACTAKFHTGNLIDTTPPTVSVSEPLEGQAVPADSLVTLRAYSADDSGISYVAFTDNGNSVDQSGPNASSSPLVFNAEAQWDTAGIPLQSERQIRATAYDIDAHETESSPVSVVVRSPSCFNGVKDGDETDIDCGGTPNTPGFCGACSGGSCSSNSQCASSVCQNNVCVEQPTIISVSPLNGKPGTFVTLTGANFGASGHVTFFGGPGAADDKLASPPQACIQGGFSMWNATQVIVAVPDGAASGPVGLTNGASGLSDQTSDTRGPQIPDFLVDDSSYPGICGLAPTTGFVGDQFKINGGGFGTAPASVAFGSSNLTSFSSWMDAEITANVPVVGNGKQIVKVKAGSIWSNPSTFLVQSKATAGPPSIAGVDPTEGPRGEYVTLTGKNFGSSVGTVRFKQVSTGDEALGDTSFPSACSAGYWKQTNVVVKVPQEFLISKQQLAPGAYTVRLIRSDNAESNAVSFSVTSGNAKPGICATVPSAGPVGTDVSLHGERFGSDSGAVSFYDNKSAIASSWTNGEVKTSVPTGAVTGPVTLTASGIKSNGVNFQVRNCNEESGVCGANEQCCGNGACVPKEQACGMVSQSAMFAWQSSTGLIPVAPRVVEECAPKEVPAPIPSPSPWNARAGGENACVNAAVVARFTTHLDPTTATKANFKLKKCTSASNEPCATTTDVEQSGSSPLLQVASADQDLVRLQPKADFDTDTTYLVQVLTGVKGAGISGANMDESDACGKGVGYCFRFKTRSSKDPCAIGAVGVSPHPYELNEAGGKVPYLASPISKDDACVVLQCEKYDWEWEHGDANGDGRAIFDTPLNTEQGKISCKQTGVAITETGNVPVNMNAIAKPDNVKGIAQLYVKFIPPRVEDYAPRCQLACINSLIWARFSQALDPNSIVGNVEVRPCANENCVLTELGSPLEIPSNYITVVQVPKTTETVKRFLSIKPIKADQTLLLQPGKYYRVLLKGGTDSGIKGMNGVLMTGLNDPDGFVWTFRTKLGPDSYCKAESVDVAPIEKYETLIDARQLFVATPFGKADECSAVGQALIQTQDASWASSDKDVADFVGLGKVDTGAPLPAQCSAICLAMGSQAQYGKVAVCGNGIIETTDTAYCKGGITPYGDVCSVLPSGATSGEQCDPGVPSNVGQCDPNTCLWKPVSQIPSGTCGNGDENGKKLDFGEACDFGAQCQGASPTSTTPDGTFCTKPADKAACEKNGGTCAPRQYRGCSTFCRHTGSLSAKSTCGNGDLADGEDCDDGNLTSNDGCSNQCLHTGSSPSVSSVCGNAILEPGETCEKQSVSDPTFPAGCNGKTCLHIGNSNTCGNGVIDAGEDCEDGNTTGGDGCNASCLLEGSSVKYLTPSFCSDGIVGIGEQCDAGLPSSHASLLEKNNSKNSTPVPPVGTAIGDGLVDNVQLAYIVGDADPDENGIMSSKISALVEGKTGEAAYGLQCAFTDEKACKPNAQGKQTGLTDKGCCSLRPEIATSYPSGTGVCRNVEISAVFNAPMNAESVMANIQIAKEDVSGKCPDGTTTVTDDFRPAQKGILGWFERLWNRIVTWWTGDPAFAAVWCKGSVSGSLVPASSVGTSAFKFKLDAALEPDTKYRVKFFGDNSTTTDPFSDNADLAQKLGIKTSKGVVAKYDASAESGPLTFSFTTGKQICLVDLIQVTDTSKEHPLLFVKQNEQHPFQAQAIALNNNAAVPIVPVKEYYWDWLPWSTSGKEVVAVLNPQPKQTTATVQADNQNGNEFVMAWLKITADTVSDPPTADKTIHGSAPVTVSLCENPWPSLEGPGPIAPFRDKKPTGNGQDSSLGGTIFGTGPNFYNFSTMYCRDAGAAGIEDDLPKLAINPVPPTTTDQKEGILRQYLFTYGDENKALKKDGIGIRVASNPLHYSPEDWYKWRGFGGKPKSILVDGYRALQDGTTTYVAAANTDGPGTAIYSNIYLISRNPDASPVTVGIYDQMVKSLAFNINLKDGVGNACEKGNDPNLEPAEPYYDDAGYTMSCSSDFDCLKLGTDFHCGSYKLKLSRDTERVADFQSMSRVIEAAKSKDGAYPKLLAGTFLFSYTNSRWPSWDAEFSKSVGGKQPADPVNEFVTCGKCSKSGTPCGGNQDCPTDESCTGVTVKGNDFITTTSTEPLTCWNVDDRKFVCPRIGISPSRVYQYHSLNGGQRYELSSEFEVQPLTKNGAWWSPSLMTEIKRCANTETLGFLCDEDKDCRPCPDPKNSVSCPENKYPTVAGSCRFVGGRFIYKDVCTNQPIGQSGTCGDGKIGQACSGGTNDKNPCTKGDDCPGGSCTANEVCEIGQTKLTDCDTKDPNNKNPINPDGLKLQVCNECKEFLDDVNLSQCNASVACGNGRIDKVCSGGVRNALGCEVDSECKGDGGNIADGKCVSSGELCDDGILNGSYGHCNIKCNGYAAYCGDQQISPGEICDNGPSNLQGTGNGDYCDTNAACTITNSCSLDCKSIAPYCGDTVVTAPEQCDGQTQTTTKGICKAGSAQDEPCSVDADCGEQGICASGADTLASCEGKSIQKCAGSLKQCVTPTYDTNSHDPTAGFKVCKEDADCAKEQGGKTACRSVQEFVSKCSSDVQCSLPTIPGVCQEYPTAHIRTCNTSGLSQCSYTSWSGCKVLNFCGDGITDKPSEECDDGSGNGDTKACTSSCKKNVCGDGKPLMGVEDCDAGAQNGKVTCSADYNSTCASCSTQCKFLTTAGGYCGDAKKNGPEQCDGNVELMESPEDKQKKENTVKLCGTATGLSLEACSILNAQCVKTPCITTTENNITCKSLGYDFSINTINPSIYPLDSELNQTVTCGDVKLKKYENIMLTECMGSTCGKGGLTYPKPLPSSNDFWACVREKGPALGVGIKGIDTPAIVSCNSSCSFSGCGKCSDDIGTGTIEGQLFDAVYNQVVPLAKVSLFYKGILVKQTSSDDDGKFQVTGLNNRNECSQYKLIVDKYDDNPCTGNQPDRPNCGYPKAPGWQYAYTIDEGIRGGYWPLTSPTFGVGNFLEAVSPKKDGKIYLFPRPGKGEAYFTVLWEKSWTTMTNGISGGFNNHLVIPESYAYTATSKVENIKSCNYANRPASTQQCARDITWSSGTRGNLDVSQLPYAYLLCLHNAGEKVGGYADDYGEQVNNCPIEGRDACLQANPGDYAKCSKGLSQAMALAMNKPWPCEKVWWDNCDFYKEGPLTTYFRYSAFGYAQEPLRMYWDYQIGKSIHALNNDKTNALKNRLLSSEYKAVISTDKQILEVDSKNSKEVDSKNSKEGKCGGDCKFWYIADLYSGDGSVIVKNELKDLRPNGIAVYEHGFDGFWRNGKYCANPNDASYMYKVCNSDDDCNKDYGFKCITYKQDNPAQWKAWSQANY